MSDHVSKTIEMVLGQIRELEQQVIQKKRIANSLCELAGAPVLYPEEDLNATGAGGPLTPDAYYGKALATVVREVLERRKRAGHGAATVSEIYDAMKAGGYHFNTKSDENAKRGLYVSLSKNSSTFHKLPNGTYGLLDWYPNAKPATVANGKKNPLETEPDGELEDEIAPDEFGESTEEVVVPDSAVTNKPR